MQKTAVKILEEFRRKYMEEGEWDVSQLTPETVTELETIAGENADACALLWAYYWWEGEEDTAWEWRDKALDLGSELMQAIAEDEMEEEIGEDDWEQEFEAYDDETEAGG